MERFLLTGVWLSTKKATIKNKTSHPRVGSGGTASPRPRSRPQCAHVLGAHGDPAGGRRRGQLTDVVEVESTDTRFEILH